VSCGGGNFGFLNNTKKTHRNFGTFQPSLIANDSEVSGKSNLKYSPKGLC
jgi:hypothetical protein